MEWGEFAGAVPRAHLISGAFDPTERWRGRARFSSLATLVVALKPGGQWAINKMDRKETAAIYVAYADQADALKLRRAVGAVKASRRVRTARWITHYEFWFDRAMHEEIMRLAAPSPPAAQL